MDEIKILPMMYYSNIPILVILLLITISLILFFKKENKNIKDKYILKLKILENKITLKKIDNKKSFKQLSKIIREYISETTDYKVINYSLSEIKKINNDKLTSLIEECYKYEFSNSNGDIKKAINKAKDLIK